MRAGHYARRSHCSTGEAAGGEMCMGCTGSCRLAGGVSGGGLLGKEGALCGLGISVAHCYCHCCWTGTAVGTPLLVADFRNFMGIFQG